MKKDTLSIMKSCFIFIMIFDKTIWQMNLLYSIHIKKHFGI